MSDHQGFLTNNITYLLIFQQILIILLNKKHRQDHSGFAGAVMIRIMMIKYLSGSPMWDQ